MATLWNQGNDKNRDVFEQHTERMKLFGKFHTIVREDTKRGGSSSNSLLSNTITLSGGANLSRTGWSDLVSAWKVTPRRFSLS